MTDNTPSSANGPPSLRDRVKELQLSNQLGAGRVAKSRSSTAWLPWLLCILMALAWAGVGIRWYKSGAGKSENGAPSGEPAARGPATSEEQRVSRGEIVLENTGYIIPSHTISISPVDVAGRVNRLEIEEGKIFKKGDVLAAIDDTRFLADKKEAEAQVAAAEARLAETRESWVYEKQQADAELAEAKAQWAKDELEYQTAKATLSGAVAKVELGTLQRKAEASKEHVKVMEVKRDLAFGKPRERRIEAAARDLDAAIERDRRAKWSLDNCTIKAPVTGMILTKKAEIGALINPGALNSGATGGVSTGICDIADLRELEVDLEIQERDIAKITEGMTCVIRPAAYPNKKYDGYFDRAMPIGVRARGIIPVRVRVIVPPDEEQGKFLKPEMNVTVTFYSQPFPVVQMVLPTVWQAVEDVMSAAKAVLAPGSKP